MHIAYNETFRLRGKKPVKRRHQGSINLKMDDDNDDHNSCRAMRWGTLLKQKRVNNYTGFYKKINGDNEGIDLNTKHVL